MSSERNDSSRRAKPASPRSSTTGKVYSSRGETRRSYVARLPEATYEALMDASAATGVSANALVTEAVEDYLTSTRFHARLDAARAAQEPRTSKADEAARRQREAIAKLAGG